jgi:hypothetical protein
MPDGFRGGVEKGDVLPDRHVGPGDRVVGADGSEAVAGSAPFPASPTGTMSITTASAATAAGAASRKPAFDAAVIADVLSR